MKIYRLHMTVDNGVSVGYEYFTARSKAEKRQREHMRDNDGEMADANDIQEMEFSLTKIGVVKLLNRWGDHPDNG